MAEVDPRPVAEARPPDRHTLRAAFGATRVRIQTGGRWLEVHPAGTGPRPGWAEGAGAIAVLTAWNPGAVDRPLAENQRRQRQLQRQLDQRGLVWLAAAGIGERGDWAEASVAVRGLERSGAGQLARQWGQVAHFEWRPEDARLGVIWADGAVDQWPVGVDQLVRRPCPMAPPGEHRFHPCQRPVDPAARALWTRSRQTLVAAAGCDVCHGESRARSGGQDRTGQGGIGAGQEEG